MITIGSIGSFAGNLGTGDTAGDITVSDVSVVQVQRLVEQIRQHADALEAAGVDRADLDRRVSAIEEEAARPKPDQGRMRGLLQDLRNTMAGASGNLIASGVIAVLNQILGTGVPSP